MRLDAPVLRESSVRMRGPIWSDYVFSGGELVASDDHFHNLRRAVADLKIHDIAKSLLMRQVHRPSVMVVRLLKSGPAAGCHNITRGTFRSRIDVADHDRSAPCSKRERGSAAYPRRGTRD